MATNVKILLRRGLRSELSASGLDAGELGYTEDTKQLYVGTSASVDEIIFDPFANAHSIVQTFLNQHTAEPELEIDEDLIIRSISDVPALLTAMQTYGIITAGAFEPTVSAASGSFVIDTVYTILTSGTTDYTLIGAADSVVGTVFTATGSGTGTGTATYGKEYKIKTVGTTDFTLIGATDNNVGTIFTTTGIGTGTGTAIDTYDHFYANLFASERKNVEVLTENSFSQVYANMHLQSHTSADGRRPDLFKKELTTTSGTFLKYPASESTSFFIDYSLKQVGATDTFVRVGTIRVINGEAITPALTGLVKLTDDNTEIWHDDGDLIAEADEFSNIEFTSEIDNAVRTAGTFIVGIKYKILVSGTTDFTLIGAADSNVGTTFTATGVGTGTGTTKLAVIPMNINYTQGRLITSGAFVIGTVYTIVSVDDGIGGATTDYTSIGSADNAVGTTFTATGVGTGTGTANANFTTEISYTVKRWTM